MPARNPLDFAIVVGVQHYPGFGRADTQPNDLQGPDNDAGDVYDWLVSDDGGGLDKDNVRLIRSRDFGPPFQNALAGRPQKQAIVDAFSWLESLAQANAAAMRGLKVGRRLYVYMSGHGFAPRRKQAAIFLANATRVQTYHHVFASGWVEWFYDARYFDEFVLLMDCCMAFDLAISPENAGFRTLQGPGPGGNLFSAYAARFPLKAVERLMPDGKHHGVFTYALLQGLKGEAADPATMRITSESLRRYLTNAMKTFMSQADLDDASVGKEPDFGADDPIDFGVVKQLPLFKARLRVPASGQPRHLRVLTGDLEVVKTGTVQGEETVEVALPKGVYFATADNPSVVKDFELIGAAEVDVLVA